MAQTSVGQPDADPVTAVRDWLAVRGASVVDSTPRRAEGQPSESRTRPRSADGVEDRASAASTGPSSRPMGDDADPEAVARSIVLRKLSAHSRTRAELAKALKVKAVPEDAAATVLDRMTEVGLVNDAVFARDWVASRQQRRHLSRSALRRELQGKGVDRDDIEEALAPVGMEDEYAAASSLASRRQKSMAALPRDVQYRRLAGVLARRGFGASIVSRVLSEVVGGAGLPD